MLNIVCVYMCVCVSFIMVYILFYIYNIYDLSSMNDVQVVDTGGNRCDRERERERESIYKRKRTLYTVIYLLFHWLNILSDKQHLQALNVKL